MGLDWHAWVAAPLVGCALLFGCSDGTLAPPIDASLPPVDSAVPRPRVLEVVSEPTIVLLPGETRLFEVRYTEEDGTPIEGATMTFGFQGEAHDTTLATFEASTGPNGTAAGIVSAGFTPAAFRIRITAEGAPAVFIDVAVSTDGIGSIQATVEGEATGREVTRRVVSVFSGTTCAASDLPDRESTRASVILAAGETEATFTALPPSIDYAVTVRAEGPDGALVGWGCAEATVRADETSAVVVSLAPLPLEADGLYATAVTVRMPSAAILAAGTLEAQGGDFLTSVGGVGALLLDSIEAELRAIDPDLADILSLTREGQPGILEADLELALENAGVGPEQALAAVGQQVREELVALRVSGPLTIDRSSDAPVSWEPSEVSIGASLDAPTATVPLSELGPEAAGSLGLTFLPSTDSVELTSVTVTMPLGQLTFALLDANATGLADPLAVLLTDQLFGCGALADWIALEPQVSGLCDAACAEGACLRAAVALAADLRDAEPVLNGSQQTISIAPDPGAVAPLQESTGDLAVDGFAFEGLAGAWTSDGGGTGLAITADLDATRTGDLP